MFWKRLQLHLKKIPLLLCGLFCHNYTFANPNLNADHLVSGIMSYTDWGDLDQINFCIIDGTPKLISEMIFTPPSPLIRPNKVKILNLDAQDFFDRSTSFYDYSCHVLYFVTTDDATQQKILNDIPSKILSISENNSECTIGSAFCLYNHNRKISFKVNLHSLKRSKVRVNSKVLMLSQTGGKSE